MPMGSPSLTKHFSIQRHMAFASAKYPQMRFCVLVSMTEFYEGHDRSHTFQGCHMLSLALSYNSPCGGSSCCPLYIRKYRSRDYAHSGLRSIVVVLYISTAGVRTNTTLKRSGPIVAPETSIDGRSESAS